MLVTCAPSYKLLHNLGHERHLDMACAPFELCHLYSVSIPKRDRVKSAKRNIFNQFGFACLPLHILSLLTSHTSVKYPSMSHLQQLSFPHSVFLLLVPDFLLELFLGVPGICGLHKTNKMQPIIV